MTMVMLTAMAIARERERGTLGSSSSRHQERRAGGGQDPPLRDHRYVQITLTVGGARDLRRPLLGSAPLLYALVRFHRRQPGPRALLFDHRQDPATSHANVLLFLFPTSS
jgi:hypothetical protein